MTPREAYALKTRIWTTGLQDVEVIEVSEVIDAYLILQSERRLQETLPPPVSSLGVTHGPPR